jgi:Flp pilus assembly protein TadG
VIENISKTLFALANVLARRRNAAAAFYGNQSGSVAILFAVASVMIFCAVGAGLDLSRAYQTRQKLAEVAMLGCQYATRSKIDAPVAASNAGTLQDTDYVGTVTSFIQTSLTSQNLAQTQTTSAPFTFTPGGSSQITLTATVPTLFMQIVHVSTIPVSVTAKCFTTIAQTNPSTSDYLIQEGFETHVYTNVNWYEGNGTVQPYSQGVVTIPKITSFNTANTYTGSNGATWVIMGYCVETDLARAGGSDTTAPQGSYTAELDCDNGSGTAGDSSISNKQYLNVGEYELRYYFRGRVDYPDYDPTYICGTQLSDESWATGTNVNYNPVTNNAKNNQIDVFLDADQDNSAPTHLINDGTMSLAGSNLIDSCVYANNWVQRSVRIYVSTPGFYWLSFAADGTNNSFGGQLDQIQLCIGTCPGSLQDNFPFTASESLFEDTFESPAYTGSPYNTNGNMYNSNGTSGTESSGWPSAPASGWALAPTNQLPYWRKSCAQGTQCIELGWNADSLISRPFLLDPGYYQVNYDYVSEVTFPNLSGVYCGATPSLANITSLSSQNNSSGNIWDVPSSVGSSLTEDTNTVGVFMSQAQEASTPNLNSTLGSTTTYTNPNGTTTTTPTVAPNGISLTSYNASQVNPLLDICGYASTWQTRSAVVYIQKPAYYWLTFSALGNADAFGGFVDDVKLTALTSPYYSTYSSGAVTIPVPTPQPSSDVNYTGFYIVADPLTPPAP